jgi:membrane-bound serine protease (ClpP class)
MTHTGAAHPVTMQGKMDKTMGQGCQRSGGRRGALLKTGKNAKWAEEAEKKRLNHRDGGAARLIWSRLMFSLVKALHGKTVDLVIGKKTLSTVDAEVKEIKMGFRYRVLEVISNPNIAYILMILGFYGLYFELSNPGAIFPGVAGAICLVLAFYALQTLPINYAGLLLILGIGLFIAEAFITSHGVLGIGGTISMLLGSVMLIDSPAPVLQISWAVIIPVVVFSAVLFIITVTIAVRVYREKPDTGIDGIVGLQATAKTDIHADGQVFMRGEYWTAWSDEPILKGENVTVVAVEGLKVKVKKSTEQEIPAKNS